MAEAWATLRVELATSAPDDDEAQADVRAMGLDGLAALIAGEPDVGGVETRDESTLGGVTQPELWVYTTPAALETLGDRVDALAATFGLQVLLTARVRDDDDWRDEWKRFYRPRVFGRPPSQLLLRPSWIDRSDDDPVLEVVVDPGRAFGTGLHESTRLCLHRLCAIAGDLGTSPQVLDLGCGSGILALATARLIPSAKLLAADFDAEATATTVENIALNKLQDRIQVETGELQALPRQPFELLIANIRPVVLVPLAGTVMPWLAPGARVLLSGIFGDEVERVRAAWLAEGFTERATETEGDWSLLELEAPRP